MKRALLSLLGSLLLTAPLLVATGEPRHGHARRQRAPELLDPPVGHRHGTSTSRRRPATSAPARASSRTPPAGSTSSTAASTAARASLTIRFSTSTDGSGLDARDRRAAPDLEQPRLPSASATPAWSRAGAYYYLAYTGSDRTKHAVFVARTTSLTQPWQKWNGLAWGGPGRPRPIITAPQGTAGLRRRPALARRPAELARHLLRAPQRHHLADPTGHRSPARRQRQHLAHPDHRRGHRARTSRQ